MNHGHHGWEIGLHHYMYLGPRLCRKRESKTRYCQGKRDEGHTFPVSLLSPQFRDRCDTKMAWNGRRCVWGLVQVSPRTPGNSTPAGPRASRRSEGGLVASSAATAWRAVRTGHLFLFFPFSVSCLLTMGCPDLLGKYSAWKRNS